MERSKRVGRGGKRGKTAGRGTKGQKARAGHKIRPEMRDIIKKLPKRRGYGKNRARTVVNRPRTAVVNLKDLMRFEDGAAVTPAALIAHGLVRRSGGAMPPVKVLGTGTLSKRLTLSGMAASRAARTAIEKAGGSIQP